MKRFTIELVKDFDGSYYINFSPNADSVSGMPEYVSYATLKKEFARRTGYKLPALSGLEFTKVGRKQYAHFDVA